MTLLRTPTEADVTEIARIAGEYESVGMRVVDRFELLEKVDE